MGIEDARRHASKQLGLLSREDLARFGIRDRTSIGRLRKAGELERLWPGVWRVGGAAQPPRQRWLGALLWAGDGVLSHQTAAHHHGLIGVEDPRIHLTVARRGASAPTDLCVHTVGKPLPRTAVVRVGRLKLTTVQRTLLDLAVTLDEAALQAVVEEAWHRGKLDPSALLAQLRGRRRKGSRKLRRLLRGALRRQRPLESPLEVLLWRALRDVGFRRPKVQVEVPDAWGHLNRADFVYERERVVIEALGWEWHRDRFEEDAERTTRLVASGYRVLPVTWRMMKEKPELVVGWVGTALRRGRQQKAR
jgi:very-short-patch-repair endonuclease